MKESTAKRVEMEKRRRKVAALYLRKVKQEDIADKLKVSQSTVSRDLTWLRKQWREAAVGDVDARRGQELAELEEMELDCTVQFSASKDPRFLNLRLRIKERIAKLLGLDAPERREITGAGGKAVELAIVDKLKRVVEMSEDEFTDFAGVVPDLGPHGTLEKMAEVEG